jgi:hypothetical protein
MTEVSEMKSHSFVVKVAVDAKDKWHGYISHVSEGERKYFRHLNEIPLFIAPYLQDLNIDLGADWPLWCWVFSLGQKRV